jgi:hypothetical protein
MGRYDKRTPKLRAGTIKRLHVDQHVIRSNRSSGGDDPPVTVQLSTGSLKCSHAIIHGKSELIYSPEKPLACGARLWVETRARVEIAA